MRPSRIFKSNYHRQEPRDMDYFMIKQSGSMTIPRALTAQELQAGKLGAETPEISVRAMTDLSPLDRYDYLASEHLLSDRLKLLLEQYLPEQNWRPCVFIDQARKLQKVFWFLPPLPYQPERIDRARNGLPCAVYVAEQDFAMKSPGIFCIHNHKGPDCVIVHLSIAESMLRRGICGLELVRLGGG